jgi:hypothetical protein
MSHYAVDKTLPSVQDGQVIDEMDVTGRLSAIQKASPCRRSYNIAGSLSTHGALEERSFSAILPF